MTNAIILISAIVGIIVGFFIILDRIITIKKSKPILDFNIGLTPVFGSEKDFLVKVKKGSYKISTLFLGAEIESNSQWMFGCPYLLVNNSKLPIQNITIILEYSIKY